MESDQANNDTDQQPAESGHESVLNEQETSPDATLLALGPRPWGPWATIGWTVLCLLLMVAVQLGVLIGFLVFSLVTGSRSTLEDLATSALLLSVASFASTIVVVPLIWFLIRLRRCPVRPYLALRLPRKRQALMAIGGLAVLLAASDLTTYLLGRPIVPQVIVDFYRSGWVPLLVITLLMVAPVGEEVIFRGFLYLGVAASPWGPWPAIVLSSVGWATLHIQYDLFGVALIFISGLYLGLVRQRTASLPLCMLLHALSNLVATAEVMIKVHYFS
jgi:membrane protease YdiL (CAAX protease family)